MTKNYSAFISCRFDECEVEVIGWFKNKFEAFDIDCYIASGKKASPPLEKVINAIVEKDCLIAIVPQKRSSLIDSEIGMAIAFNKPVIAFYENKVDPSGPYRIMADAVTYERDSLDKSTDTVIQLLNSLVRILDSKSVTGSAQNILAYRLLSSESEIQQKLIEMLKCTNKSLDIWAYSTETFLKDGFLSSVLERKGTKLRILVRDPSSDPKKGPVIEGHITSVLSAFSQNRISVNLYTQEPFVRCAIFDSSFGLFGIYRWVPDTYYEFIGAENNSLVELKGDTALGKLWIGLVESRFEYAWIRSVPFSLRNKR